jgi:hypothetical protein
MSRIVIVIRIKHFCTFICADWPCMNQKIYPHLFEQYMVGKSVTKVNRRFRGSNRPHLQGRRINRARNYRECRS